jgi:hypothetical protein
MSIATSKRARSLVVVLAVVMLGFLVDNAAGETVNLSGKHSKASIDKTCASEGGESYTAAGGGYGCMKGDNTVACKKDGTCQGFCSNCGAREVGKTSMTDILNPGTKPTLQSNQPGTPDEPRSSKPGARPTKPPLQSNQPGTPQDPSTTHRPGGAKQ